MKRVLSAVVFLPLFWLIVKRVDPLYDALIAAAALLALFELYRMTEIRARRGLCLTGAAVTLLYLASFARPGWPLQDAILLGLFALPIAAMARGGDLRGVLADVGAAFFGATYIGVLFGYLLGLRALHDPPKGDETGSDLVFLLFFVVWSSDTAAYFVGRALGRRPLAPRISPRKTVEGALGGLAGALLASFVARAWFIARLLPRDCLILGLSLGLVGIAGDLVESMFKRGAGVKDSARLVPGHGGILDRVDSLLYAGPVLYYYYLFAMRGP